MSSIRARLLAGLLASITVTAIVAGVVTYRRVLAETSTLFDYQLRQMALSLRDQAEIAPRSLLPERATEGDFYVQIWVLFGNRVYVSRRGMLIERAYLGYADMVLNDERWRVYSLQTGDAVIQVAQPWSVREQLARAAAARVLLRLLPLLLLMAAAVIWIVGRGLAPLKRLAREVQRRDVHGLAPIEAPELPQEAAPLIEEMRDKRGSIPVMHPQTGDSL